MIKATLNSVPNLIRDHRQFNCNGSLFGTLKPLQEERHATFGSAFGKLPWEYIEEFRIACSATDFYAVYSYQTPIAWYANGVWTVPPVKYSVTTSRHQGRVNLVVRSAA